MTRKRKPANPEADFKSFSERAKKAVSDGSARYTATGYLVYTKTGKLFK